MNHHHTPIKTRPFLARKLICIAGLMAFTILATPVHAEPLKLDFPSVSPGVPAYARIHLDIVDFNVPSDGEWSAVVFYRDPECIPVDFDLGQFFHLPGPTGPGAFDCDLLVEGHELWTNGPGIDPSPFYVRSRNLVPNQAIWFVRAEEINDIFDTGQVYIDEIESLPSLIRGYAWWFEEALYPEEQSSNPALTIRTQGVLETGGQFRLESHSTDGGQGAIVIDLDLPHNFPPGVGPPDLCKTRPHLPFC